ncbi:MAG: carboxypeptidase regulatory-like domain-containing protein [Gammaproteobacteria bacterium]
MERKSGLLVAFGLITMGLLGCSPDAQMEVKATLSGSVVADQPFKAARVIARHLDKNVIYTVYTQGGDYHAVHLFPGRYELNVDKPGFETPTQRIEIESGENAEANFKLTAVDSSLTAKEEYAGSKYMVDELMLADYDEIYPPGPGRVLVEATCITCHGVNYLPGGPRNRSAWDAALDLMMNAGQAYGVEDGASLISPDAVDPQEREVLLTYLVENFSEHTPQRAVRIDAEMPLDEAALGKAMYVEYELPDTEQMSNRWIQEPHFDQAGNVWFTERGFPSAMTRLDPRTASYKDFMIPDPAGSPHGVVVDPDGSVWWAGRSVYLARLNPGTGDVTEYPIEKPGLHGHTPVLDSKNNIWFSMLPGNRIGKWDRQTEEITIYKVPTARARPYGIVVDVDDKIWFAEFHVCRIGRFDPETELFTEYPALTEDCTIRRLGVDSKGIIWFGLFSAGKLARLDPKTGEVIEYDIPTTFSEPYDTWPDADDNIWISDGGQRGALIRFNQEAETFTFYPTRLRSDMPKLAITRDNAIWYSARWAARSPDTPATVGVLYPDVTKIETLAAFY